MMIITMVGTATPIGFSTGDVGIPANSCPLHASSCNFFHHPRRAGTRRGTFRLHQTPIVGMRPSCTALESRYASTPPQAEARPYSQARARIIVEDSRHVRPTH